MMTTLEKKQSKLEYQRVWRKNNPEKTKASAAKYRSKNREKLKKASAAWRKENPEKMAKCISNWRKNNPEKAKMIQDRTNANNAELRSQYYKDRRKKYNAYMVEYRKNNLERCREISRVAARKHYHSKLNKYKH